jgi:diaminopimelate decarboxylase
MSGPAHLRHFPPFDAGELTRAHGSPLFLFSPDVLRNNADRLRDALRRRHPRTVVGYSVKTNHLPYVVRTVIEHGVVPEIVSGLELDLLERMGGLTPETIVNGPLKTDDELARTVRHGCRVNVDNLTELEVLERVAAAAGRTCRIGLRVTAEIGQVPWLRFGFRAEEVEDAARRVRASMPHLRVVGLHIHGGTNITEASYYAEASRLLCDLARRLASAGLMTIEYLDVGGGFATDCPFKDRAAWAVPTADEYAEAITGPLRAAFGADAPTLIVEPGRYLVDDAFLLLTTVWRVRGLHQDEVVVDAGVNVFPSARFRRHRVANLTGGSRPAREYSLFGPLCMQSDCLGERVPLAGLRPGDILCLDYAGAYSLSQSWTFIRLHPAVVALEGGTARLVRRAQDVEDFLARDSHYELTARNA